MFLSISPSVFRVRRSIFVSPSLSRGRSISLSPLVGDFSLSRGRSISLSPSRGQSLTLSQGLSMRRCMAARSDGDHRQRPPPLTFPPSFPHSTPFPHGISQNEIIKVTDNNYRPDLTKAALARLSAVNRRLKVAKSGAKKWNMQALKK